MVPILILFYQRTRLGLHIRVVGEKPEAAEAQGLSITRIRYIASLLCGVLAGLAGAHLSLGYITMFTENMSSGRGFMAVAILIFSNGDPLKVLAGCLLFGFSDALAAPPADLWLPVLSGADRSLSRRSDRPLRASPTGRGRASSRRRWNR